MLTDWIHWLSCRHPDQLFSLLGALLLTDGPRYAIPKLLMCLYDWCAGVYHALLGAKPPPTHDYCPTVCAIVAGHNEAETIALTLSHLWGSYPRLEIIVVDDGSTDGMAETARCFARKHSGVLVLSRPDRGGKSSAMNFGLPYTKAEVPERTEIRLKSATKIAAPRPRIVLEFTGVSGRLQTPGRPTGFALKTSAGETLDWIFKAEFDPARPSAVILWASSLPGPDVALYYGAGPAPYVNIVDDEDMALPAFGPVIPE